MLIGMPVSRLVGCLIIGTCEWDLRHSRSQFPLNHVVLDAHRGQTPRQMQVILTEEVSALRAGCSSEMQSDVSYTGRKRVCIKQSLRGKNHGQQKTEYIFEKPFLTLYIPAIFALQKNHSFVSSENNFHLAILVPTLIPRHKNVSCLVGYLNILH